MERLRSVGFTVLITLAASAVSIAVSPVAQATTCSPAYRDGGYHTNNYANRGIQGYVTAKGLGVANSNQDHALAYIDAEDNSDSSAPLGYDLIQAGFGIGAVGTAQDDNKAVYSEKGDFNGQTDTFYHNLPTANEFFTIFDTGQSDGLGDHLFQAQEADGLNFYNLKSGWMVSPHSLVFRGYFEGLNSVSGSCPKTDASNFGTTGSYPDYTSGTELQIEDSQNTYKNWTPGNFSTSARLDSPYELDTAVSYSVFRVMGS